MKYLLASILSFLLLPAGHAQELEKGSTDIEEIIVIADLSKTAVQQLIIEVETDIYRMFNASNGDDKFNFTCRNEVPTGSHFPQRVCEPAFLSEARAENISNSIAGTDIMLSAQGLRGQLVKEFEKLNARYAKLIEEDKIFAEVVGILTGLQLRLTQL